MWKWNQQFRKLVYENFRSLRSPAQYAEILNINPK
jgi:hypothetical protein